VNPKHNSINKFFRVDYTCPKCKAEKVGFRAVPETCKKCKVEMEVSSIQNHKVDGIRGFRQNDKGNQSTLVGS
jgi:hypothetical protein